MQNIASFMIGSRVYVKYGVRKARCRNARRQMARRQMARRFGRRGGRWHTSPPDPYLKSRETRDKNAGDAKNSQLYDWFTRVCKIRGSEGAVSESSGPCIKLDRIFVATRRSLETKQIHVKKTQIHHHDLVLWNIKFVGKSRNFGNVKLMLVCPIINCKNVRKI